MSYYFPASTSDSANCFMSSTLLKVRIQLAEKVGILTLSILNINARIGTTPSVLVYWANEDAS